MTLDPRREIRTARRRTRDRLALYLAAAVIFAARTLVGVIAHHADEEALLYVTDFLFACAAVVAARREYRRFRSYQVKAIRRADEDANGSQDGTAGP